MSTDARYTQQIFQVSGLDCPDCASSLEKIIRKTPGVKQASLQFPSGKLTVEHNIDTADIIALVEKQGYGAIVKSTANTAVHTFKVDGLDCPDCAESLKSVLLKTPGVKQLTLRFPGGKLMIEHTGSPSEIIRAVEGQGYSASIMGQATTKKVWWKNAPTLSLAAGVFLLFVSLFSRSNGQTAIAHYSFAACIIAAGWPVFRAAFHSLLAGVMDMNVLMTAAVLGAVFLDDWLEASAVVILFGLGRVLQAYTLARAERSLNALLSAAPTTMLKIVYGKTIEIDSSTIEQGDELLVRTGEVLAVDATVREGRAAINQASITGESLPRDVGPGDKIFAGSYPTDSQLVVAADGTTETSMLSRIQELVESAQAQKTPSQEFAEKFARIYTPLVIAATFLIVAVPWLFYNQPFETWLYRGLVLLVIACPCALILASPVVAAAAISTASRLGILIKGGAALENAGKANAVALDKTGTLSTGQLAVANIYAPYPFSKEDVLRLTAALETSSRHPAALAVLFEAQGLDLPPVSDVYTQSGLGLSGTVEGKKVVAGSRAYLEKEGVNIALLLKKYDEYQMLGASAVFVAIDGQEAGLFALIDSIRPDAATAVEQLKKLGIRHIIMLTGDHEKVAASVKGRLGLDEAISGLLPQGKAAIIGKLKNKYGNVLMAGDGLNDAPALARADVGVAMGAAGATAAIEVADVALLNDKITSLPTLIALSKKSRKLIKQNIIFALATKAIFLVLAVFNLTTLWLAVFADTGAAMLVILNSMRMLKNRQTAQKY